MPSNDFSTIFEAAGNVVAAPVLNQTGGNPVLRGLAETLSTVSDELDSSRTRRRQASSDARESLRFQTEQEDRARAQQERDARSAAFRAVYGVNRALSTPTNPAQPSTTPVGNSPMSLASISETSAFHQEAGAMATAVIDGAVENGETDASTARRIRDAAAAAAPVIQSQEVAVSQGRMPSIAVAATVDRLFGDLINQFPGQENIIASAFKEMGVDNALFDELRTEVNRVTADRTQEQETRDTAYNRGVQDLGEAALTMNRDEVVTAGMNAMRQDQELDALSKQIALRAQQQNILTGEAALQDRQENRAGEEAVSQAAQIGIAQLAPFLERYNRIVAMMGQPGADPGLETQLASLETLITARKGAIVGNLMAAIAPNATVEDANNLRTYFNNYFDQTFIQPMTARSGENARAVEILQSRAGLAVQTAVPLISALRSIGISAAALEPLMQNLPANLLTRFQQEVQGLSRLDLTQPTARQQLVEIVEILKGNQSLASMNYDSRTAAQAFRTINSVSHSLGTNINRTGDTSSGDEFLSATGEVIVASRQLNGGSPASTLVNAGRSLLGPNFGGADMIGAITRLKNDPSQADRANVIARGYRAAAGQILLNIRNNPTGESGRFQIMWRSGLVAGQDYGDGRYQIVDTASNRTTGTVNDMIAATGGDPTLMANRSEVRPPTNLQDMVRTMNGLVDVLVQTNDWGDGARGTPREIRRYYARGEVPAGMLRERQAAAPTGATVRREINALSRDLLDPEGFTLQTDNAATPRVAPERDYSSVPFSEVKNMIRGNEGPDHVGGYNALAYNTSPTENAAGVRPPRPITEMTIGQVYHFQTGPMRAATRGRRGRGDVGSTGVGAYQFESRTLAENARLTFGERWRSIPFTPENQDRVAETLYNRSRGSRRSLGQQWAVFH